MVGSNLRRKSLPSRSRSSHSARLCILRPIRRRSCRYDGYSDTRAQQRFARFVNRPGDLFAVPRRHQPSQRSDDVRPWRTGVDSLYEPHRKDRQVVEDREEEALTTHVVKA